MCWDKWKGNALELALWEDKPPFSRPPDPDMEASKCPIPMVENAPGAMVNCPGWNNSGCPAFRGLKKCWPGRPERVRPCRWLALKCDGLSVCTMSGEKPSLIPPRPELSMSFLVDSDTFRLAASPLFFSRFLMLKMESESFLESRLSLLLSPPVLSFALSSLCGLNVDGEVGPGLDLSSWWSSSWSLSVQVLSSVKAPSKKI